MQKLRGQRPSPPPQQQQPLPETGKLPFSVANSHGAEGNEVIALRKSTVRTARGPPLRCSNLNRALPRTFRRSCQSPPQRRTRGNGLIESSAISTRPPGAKPISRTTHSLLTLVLAPLFFPSSAPLSPLRHATGNLNKEGERCPSLLVNSVNRQRPSTH